MIDKKYVPQVNQHDIFDTSITSALKSDIILNLQTKGNSRLVLSRLRIAQKQGDLPKDMTTVLVGGSATNITPPRK